MCVCVCVCDKYDCTLLYRWEEEGGDDELFEKCFTRGGKGIFATTTLSLLCVRCAVGVLIVCFK